MDGDLRLVNQLILTRNLQVPLIVADNAGHQIPAEAPDLVAYAVTAVVEAARSGGIVRIGSTKLALRDGHLDQG